MRRGQRGRARIVAVVALAVALAGPVVPAHAAGRESEAGWRWPGLAAVWAWFVDCGIMIDPDGRCAASTTQLDCGSHIDPDGRCAAASTIQRDCGIMIDPDGHCATSSAIGVPTM
jgi:hypothetical protein